jgi:hypothetical protein
MIEFDCEGCGVHVVDLGRVEVPASRLCGTCARLSENILWSLYRWIVSVREGAEPCVPGRTGFEMGSSSGGPGGKPSDSSS